VSLEKDSGLILDSYYSLIGKNLTTQD